MQIRVSMLLALAGCQVGGLIGDQPTVSDDGTGGGDSSGAVADEASDDGHTSQTGGETTNASATTAGEESTTGPDPDATCEHAPSGLAPGSAQWQVDLVTWRGGDIDVAGDTVVIVGSAVVDGAWATFGLDGVNASYGFWYPEGGPTPMAVIGRHAIAFADGRFAAGYDLVEGEPCEWCNERWLVMYSAAGEVEWELSLGEGSWGIDSTPSGTIAIAGVQRIETAFVMTLSEIDATGTVLRSAEIGTPVEGPVRRAQVGPDGEVVAIGIGDGEGSWIGAYTPAYASHWALYGSTDARGGLAIAVDGDVVTAIEGDTRVPSLSRSTFDGANLWLAGVDGLPTSVATDCDNSIVVAGTSIARHDGSDGDLQWSTPLDGTAIAVAVGEDGGIFTLVDRGGDEGAVLRLAPL